MNEKLMLDINNWCAGYRIDEAVKGKIIKKLFEKIQELEKSYSSFDTSRGSSVRGGLIAPSTSNELNMEKK